MKTVHLTYTGPNAGQILCGKAREASDECRHAAYAPLDRATVRGETCKACLATWLAYAFADEPLPNWPMTAEDIAELEQSIPQSFASDSEVAEFRKKLLSLPR